jgi:hypothetical protein
VHYLWFARMRFTLLCTGACGSWTRGCTGRLGSNCFPLPLYCTVLVLFLPLLLLSPKNPKSAVAQWRGKLSLESSVLITQQQREPLWTHASTPLHNGPAPSSSSEPGGQQQQGQGHVVPAGRSDIMPHLLSCLRQQGTPGPGYEAYVCGETLGVRACLNSSCNGCAKQFLHRAHDLPA